MERERRSPSLSFAATVFLSLVAIGFATAIFAIDTFTPLGLAVAVLYVVVVLMAGRFLDRRGVFVVAVACVTLTIVSYLLQHGLTYGPSLARCLVSLLAIVITTFLALKSQAATLMLHEQASLLDITHDAIIARDLNDVITYWNRGAEQRYGWSREEALGKTPHRLLRTVFAVPLEEINSTLLSTDRWEGELVHTKRDGTKVVVASRWSVQRDAAGHPAAILETNNDITERRRAEDALRRSEANLADAQRLSKTGSFAWDVTSGEVRWSEEAYRIFEHDPMVEPTLELVRARTHPDDRASFIAILEGVMRERQQNWEVEHRIVMPGGDVKNIHVVAHASEAADRLEYVGALMDITAEKHAQEALQQAQAELAHVTRVTTLGELTASIAHEVNQPLAAIITNGEACLRWLGNETQNLEEARGAVERMIKDGNRAGEVIQRLRALTRKTDPQNAPLDINDVIHDVVGLVQREVLNYRVRLRLDLDSALDPVLGDRVQLQQVVINLIVNGIEAMANVADQRELMIRVREHDRDYALVAVRDSGVGIPPEQLDRVFNAFFTTKADGMGMGLSICRSIVEGHGGRLWASCNEGAGVTFQFTVPFVGAP